MSNKVVQMCQVRPDELTAEERAALFAALYQDFGVTRDQEWLHAAEGGMCVCARDAEWRLLGMVRLMDASEPQLQGRQVRQLFVTEAARRHGVGRCLIKKVEQMACEQGAQFVWLKARETAFGFYEKMGYGYTSGDFACGENLDAGGSFISTLTHIPHRVMRKNLE